MRSFLLLSLVGLVASPSSVEQAQCAVDSGEAVSDATDAAMFIWAASKRCGKVGMDVKCEIDASASVKSVNSMINVILKAVNKCDGLHTANKACALKASGLTEHTAALSAAAGMAYNKCEGGASNGCTVNALDVTGSFAGMGAWLAGAVGHCARSTAIAGAAAAKKDSRAEL